ncbi:glycosyltransferase [bacterium]|nr:glycosyltransferase [bacterium]
MNSDIDCKNILFFIPDLTMGGTFTLLEVLTNHLDQMCNLKVLVQRSCPNNKLNVPVENLQEENTLLSIRKLSQYLLHHEIDIVFSFMERANLIAYFACKNSKTQSILSIHNSPKYAFRDRPFTKRLVSTLFYKLIAKNTSLISVSNGISQELAQDCGLVNVTTIYNPIESIVEIKRSYTGKRLELISHCRFVKQKRLHYLLDLAWQLRQSQLDFKLSLIGEGPEFEYLQKLIVEKDLENCVEIFDDRHLSHQLLSADIYLQCSKFEGFGIGMVEAMNYGLVIIAVDCAYGPREILEDRFGVLIENQSREEIVQDMFQEVVLFDQDRKRLEDFSKKARSRSLDFDMKKILPQYIELFDLA